MLLGSEIGAALTALEPLGIDLIGMNCATGPEEMGEHLRYLSQHARVPLSVMPNAGLPVLGRAGAEYPLQPDELAAALSRFVDDYGVGLVGGCCGTTPEHLARVVESVRGRAGAPAHARWSSPRAASLYAAVPVLAGRRRAHGGGAHQHQRQQGVPRRDARRRLGEGRRHRPRGRPRGRPPHRPVRRLRRARRRGRHARGRLAAGHRLHPAGHARLDRAAGHRGRPGVPRRPGRHQQRQLRGRRGAGQPVRAGDADRARARGRRRRPVHRRGGPGAHRGVEGPRRRAARRHAAGPVGDGRGRRPRRLPHLHPGHRPGGVAPRRAGDDRGDPAAEAAPPAGRHHARAVQHLLRPAPRGPRGPQLGLPARVPEGRPDQRDRARQQDPADEPDPGRAARGGARPGL